MSPTYQVCSVSSLWLAANSFSQRPLSLNSEVIASIRNERLEILLIDDRSDFRESMSFLLTEKYGATVTEVNGGREAVDLLSAGNEFDLILLDLIMPGLNGIETYKEICQAGIACRIVVMSAHPDSWEWQEALALDIELVEKPIREEALVSILTTL